jgi:hypothetical protein
LKLTSALIIFLLYGSFAFSQGYGRKTKDAFPQQPRFEKKFWYFDLGVNYTLPLVNQNEIEGSQVADTLYKTQPKQTGNIGFGAAFGRYHLINNLYFFRYWNYGITYRWLRGTEAYTDIREVAGSDNPYASGNNTFSDHFAGMHIEINGRNKLSDNSFLQHTLGLSASYAVVANRSYNHTVPGISEKTSSQIHSYLYYKLGWGIRASKKLLVIPSLEVPVFNIYTFNSGRADMPYFNSHYWPITFSLRFMLCKPYRMKNCPPVDAIGVPEGGSQDQGQEK